MGTSLFYPPIRHRQPGITRGSGAMSVPVVISLPRQIFSFKTTVMSGVEGEFIWRHGLCVSAAAPLILLIITLKHQAY